MHVAIASTSALPGSLVPKLAYHSATIDNPNHALTHFHFFLSCAIASEIQTYSQKIPAKIRLRNKKHADNVTKRGNVVLSSGKENTGSTVGPVLLGLFLFVVVGNGMYLFSLT